MRIYGLDFTSSPGRRKPLVAVGCSFGGGILRVERAREMRSFEELREFLRRPEPWVCGLDFPFGQPKGFVEALGWPERWEGYVAEVGQLSKEDFEQAIRDDMAKRPVGSRFRHRLADRLSGSASAMMLFRVPVAKMFYRGAPLLLASGMSVVPCRQNEDPRVAVESYPALVARCLIGRRPYKSDERGKRTEELRAAREALIAGLASAGLRHVYGLTVELDEPWRERLTREPAADTLDSVLCAVQAAWAYSRREERWGVPEGCEPDEGWIIDPALLE
ncbi:DUF429 domain-containing protein [Rubrobacter calidifluminis]|uniref:DUF429 domain-containing protein n=1 Tax=Rubrobacter calidifluminis TaxID=1392640 RepID=UPI002360F2D7|nr:DUF429 domain-containing protein [Rubrobacter calidifluminis]